MIKYLSLILFFTFSAVAVFSQNQITGLFVKTEEASEDYTFFAPWRGENCYLIDNCGYVINSWPGYDNPGLTSYFLEDGNILRTYKTGDWSFPQTSNGGTMQIANWENEIIWEYDFTTEDLTQHHEVHYMSNGNILLLVWEKVLRSELDQWGVSLITNDRWMEAVYEIRPVGSDDIDVLWEWHLKDHLVQDFDSLAMNYGVVADNIGLVDINYTGPTIFSIEDWWHCNSIDYNESTDQILINSRNNGELWILDHSTTTEEARGHEGGNYGVGGDLIFRWGNPQAYDRGTADDLLLYGSHGAHWIAEGLDYEGKIMFFNNGSERPEGPISSIEIIEPSLDANNKYVFDQNFNYQLNDHVNLYGPDPELNFYSKYMSNSQQLENGNTFINEAGTGRLFEINQNKEIVWVYYNPAGSFVIDQQGNGGPRGQAIFQTFKISKDHPGLVGKDLTPGDLLENNPQIDPCKVLSSKDQISFVNIHWEVDVQNDQLYIQFEKNHDAGVFIYDLQGSLVLSKKLRSVKNEFIDLSTLSQGGYFFKIQCENEFEKGTFFID